MAAELLEALPSIPADVETPGEADADEAELSTDEMPAVSVDAEVAAYNRVALP